MDTRSPPQVEGGNPFLNLWSVFLFSYLHLAWLLGFRRRIPRLGVLTIHVRSDRLTVLLLSLGVILFGRCFRFVLKVQGRVLVRSARETVA
jgi:hypothetical protein